MTNINKARFFLLMPIILLSACRVDFSFETFVTDLFIEESIDTPAQIKVEIPSCSGREDYEDKILSLFNQNSKAKIIGCVNENMSSLLVVSISAEIATENSSRDLIIFFQKKDDTVGTDGTKYSVMGVTLLLSPTFLNNVESLMRESFQTLSYKNVLFSMSLNNDSSQKVYVESDYSWVDGEPHAYFGPSSINRREKVSFTFPDIFSDLTIKGEKPETFRVYFEK